MAAFTPRCWRRSGWPAGVVLAALLQGCSAPEAPRTILAETCRSISTATPISLNVATPAGGMLRIAIRQRGIALSAELGDRITIASAASPVDRYGDMTLLAESPQAHSYSVRVVSRDSPDITGEACISGELLDPSDRAGRAAERAFANGEEAMRARRWQVAFDDYLTAARAFDHSDRQRAAQARQVMAQLAYRQLHRGRDGYVLAQRALADFGPDADPGLRSALTELQASIVVEAKDMTPDVRRARASQLLDISSALARRAPFGARELARLTILRGFLEYASGDTRAAARFFAEAAAQCQSLRDWECHARAAQNGAELAQETGNNQLALQSYADALRFLSPSVAPQMTADIWDNLGRLQGYVGLFSPAEQSELHAIRLYAGINDCDGARRALSTLGSILVHVGSVADAVVYLKRALSHDCAPMLAVAGTAGEDSHPQHALRAATRDAPPSSGVRGACEHLPAPATLSANGAIAVFRALLALNYGAALEGDAAVAHRCVAAATPYAVTPRLQLQLANATGFAYLDDADAAHARASFSHGLAAADQARLAPASQNREFAYVGLARASLLLGRLDEARGYSMQALLLGSARADIGQVIGALQVLAMSVRAAGDRAAAIDVLRTAVNLIEQAPIDDMDAETRATFLATQHGVFEELTDALVFDARAGAAGDVVQSRIWTAFALSERGRARSLQYSLSQPPEQSASAAHAPAAAAYQDLLQQVAAVAASSAARTDWSAAVRQLQSASMNARQISEPIGAEELVAQLDRLHASFVEYATGRDDMYAFVIDADAIHVVPLGNRGRINIAAADLYEHLHDPESAAQDIERSAGNLAQLILWPLTKNVTRARVIFVADDSLNSVPFAVLPWSQDPQSARVLQHAETAVMPSALFMLHAPRLQRALHAAPRFELIGDPVFQAAAWRRDCSGEAVTDSAPPAAAARARSADDWAESLAPLPGSRTEVLAIAELARAASPASHIGVHLGCMATPTALREAADAGSDLLHIATHGYVDALRPRLSALALTRESATNPESGVFGLLDILDARARARLVVLSACDTSSGRLLPGEGVLGPAQAFLQSGAASVVASYWRIDDAATVSFMRTFYKFLLTEHLPTATAVRRAQLEHSSAGNVHDWAGFALFGWPDGGF
jgi:CHAT domain-containing protein